MALATNTRTGKIVDVPEHYIGHPVFGADLVAVDAEVPEVKPEPKKKKAKYVPEAVDADGDGLVQDGTIWERPVGTEYEGQTAPEIDIETNEENN